GEDVNGDNWASEKNRCWGGFRRRGRRGEWPGRRAGIERGSAGFWRTSWTAACGNSRAIHSGLRPTRGAAIALAHANADEGVVRQRGVENRYRGSTVHDKTAARGCQRMALTRC